MEAYTGFASVYDTFMDNVPYDEWCAYLIRVLKENGIEDGLILDLGCGTGELTMRLAEAGYDMIGVDLSDQMLQIAREKQERRLPDMEILYLMQDMREFELYGTVRAVICACDSLNYILEEEELLEVFRLVNNYLDPGGLFIFDMNTRYKYETLMGDQIFAENREECSFIWENNWYPEEEINEYDLTLFVQDGDCYRKYQELHDQRAYSVEKVRELLVEAGMKVEAVYDAYTEKMPAEDSERVLFMAREQYNSEKSYISLTE